MEGSKGTPGTVHTSGLSGRRAEAARIEVRRTPPRHTPWRDARAGPLGPRAFDGLVAAQGRRVLTGRGDPARPTRQGVRWRMETRGDRRASVLGSCRRGRRRRLTAGRGSGGRGWQTRARTQSRADSRPGSKGGRGASGAHVPRSHPMPVRRGRGRPRRTRPTDVCLRLKRRKGLSITQSPRGGWPPLRGLADPPRRRPPPPRIDPERRSGIDNHRLRPGTQRDRSKRGSRGEHATLRVRPLRAIAGPRRS